MMEFHYNEESDERDYPQTIAQQGALICIATRMRLSLKLPGTYFTTSHGALYMFNISDMSDHVISSKRRIDRSLMQFLLSIPGFRWIEIDVNKCIITIALEHKI